MKSKTYCTLKVNYLWVKIKAQNFDSKVPKFEEKNEVIFILMVPLKSWFKQSNIVLVRVFKTIAVQQQQWKKGPFL